MRPALTVYNFGCAILSFSGQATSKWAESNESKLMVLKDHLKHKSEGYTALWIGAAYIDVMSPASRREVERKKWSAMNTWVFWRLWNWKASLCFCQKRFLLKNRSSSSFLITTLRLIACTCCKSVQAWQMIPFNDNPDDESREVENNTAGLPGIRENHIWYRKEDLKTFL